MFVRCSHLNVSTFSGSVSATGALFSPNVSGVGTMFVRRRCDVLESLQVAGSRNRPLHSRCGRRPCHTMAWQSLLVQRGVPRTLAYRPDTRAPGVVGALRVRSASPLRGLLYAFWSRPSRLASARGGKRGVPRLHSMPSAALDTLYRTGPAHCMCGPHQDMV